MKSASCFLLSLFVSCVFSEIYFKEQFLDDSWSTRWVQTTHDKDKVGEWKHTAGKFYNDAVADKGIQTSQDARFYGISATFDSPFSNDQKTLVLQFQVKHEQKIDCGGGYLKLFSSSLDQQDLHGDSPYLIMFGPDICGYSTKKVHVIFNYKGKNLLTKKTISCKDDELSHLYSLVLKPDNTYEVYIDLAKVESGNLEDDWDFLAPKKIKDPNAKKPEDWDDREQIDDETDTKPEDWDKPQYIPDPDGEKADDWDEEIDGEWEPPMIENPDYQGEWKPKQVDNPNYSGKWIHPEIDNPDYVADDKLYRYSDIGAVGIDIWQVKSGSIFDNIIVTDSWEEAKEFAASFKDAVAGEKKMKEEVDKEDQAKQDAERAANEDVDEDMEEGDEDEDFIRDEL